MSFTVHVRKKAWMPAVRWVCALLCVLIPGAFALLFSGIIPEDVLIGNGIFLLIAGVFSVSLILPAAFALLAVSLYRERRPRIEVNGSRVTFCPLWRPARTVEWTEITGRTVEGDTAGERLDAALAGALLGGPSAQAMSQRYGEALRSPKGMAYTYYSGNKKLITLSTKTELENLERFDRLVVNLLAGNPPEEVPGPGPEAPPAGRKPAGKSRLVLVLAGLAAVGLAAAAGYALFPRAPAPPPDLLAGTSWLSGDDSSQWIFRRNGTFHWYQVKGETDDNYFTGTYEFHMGEDALSYLTRQLPQYGVTERSVRAMISGSADYTLENLVCISCVNRSFLRQGQEQLSQDTPSAYLGFFVDGGDYLHLVNLITGTGYRFAKE